VSGLGRNHGAADSCPLASLSHQKSDNPETAVWEVSAHLDHMVAFIAF
jgi:hypothetical protein